LDAVVDAFYPGPHGAAAIADCLFGVFSPSGRLPVTFYKQTSDLPALDNMDWYPQEDGNASQGISYRYFQGDVMYPFGHGLSYTKFRYVNLTSTSLTTSSLTTSSSVIHIKPCDTVAVGVFLFLILDDIIFIYMRRH
jgi:beta-glucosidase